MSARRFHSVRRELIGIVGGKPNFHMSRWTRSPLTKRRAKRRAQRKALRAQA